MSDLKYRTTKRKKRRPVRQFILLFLLLLAAAAALAAPTVYKGYRMYRAAIAQKPLEQAVAEVQKKSGYTVLNQIPPIYQDAVISVEDRRFYWHFGVDPISIARAAVKDISTRSFVEGGSTITQQLAKNLYFSQEKVFARKVAEVFVALDLERHYSKQEILELYINDIYYGSGYYSISAASEGYFGKAPDEMTDSECTLLAGLPNAPSAYSPSESPELARQRQQQVLAAMVANRKLTQQQADAILAADRFQTAA